MTCVTYDESTFDPSGDDSVTDGGVTDGGMADGGMVDGGMIEGGGDFIPADDAANGTVDMPADEPVADEPVEG